MKLGRPSEGKKPMFLSFRVEDDMRDAICAEAERRGVPIARVAGEWLREGRTFAAIKRKVLDL